MWLELARQLWPALAANGTLPPVTPDTSERLVREYVGRFVGGVGEAYRGGFDKRRFSGLGIAYLRYIY